MRRAARRKSMGGMGMGIVSLIFSGLLGVFSPSEIHAQDAGATGAVEGGKEVRKFLTSCAGCHTVGAGKLSGPDLITSSKWPELELKAAIKRMEKKAGLLTDEEVQALANLIRDPQALQKIKVEEAKMAQMFAAKMDPASAEIGQALYEGRMPLKNGGLACSACHMMGAGGEILGPDLSRIHSRMGEVALASAIEKSTFKIMEAAYREHPVTKQEALHLAKYLSQEKPGHKPVAVSMPLTAGVISAFMLLAVLAVYYRPAREITHPGLQRRRK